MVYKKLKRLAVCTSSLGLISMRSLSIEPRLNNRTDWTNISNRGKVVYGHYIEYWPFCRIAAAACDGTNRHVSVQKAHIFKIDIGECCLAFSVWLFSAQEIFVNPSLGNPSDLTSVTLFGERDTFKYIYMYFLLTSVILTSDIRHIFVKTLIILYKGKSFNNPSYTQYYQ